LPGFITTMVAVSGFASNAPGITACICVSEKLLIVSAAGCCIGVNLSAKVTSDPPLLDAGRKLVPTTVMVTEAFVQLIPQAGAVPGVTDVSVGTGFGAPKMLNASVFESPFCPVPDWVVRVLTNAVPGLASRVAGTVAVSVVVSTNAEVANFCPFH